MALNTKLTLDLSAAERNLRTFERSLERIESFDVSVDLDTSEADAETAELAAALEALQGVGVFVDVDTADALGEVSQLDAALDALDSDDVDVTVDVDTAGATESVGALSGRFETLAANLTGRLPQSLQGVASSIAGIGPAGLAAAAGLGVLAAGVAGLINVGQVFESADAALIRGTGALPGSEQLADLQESVRSVTALGTEDFASAAAGVADLNTATGFLGDELDAVAVSFAKVADAAGVGLADIALGLGRVSDGFGLTAAEAVQLGDNVTAAAQDTGTSVQFILDQLVRSGGSVRAVGLDAAQGVAVIAELGRNGIEAGTVFNTLAAKGVEFETLVGQLSAANDQAERLQLLKDVGFPLEGAAKFVAALDDIGPAVDRTLGSFEGRLDGTFDATDNLGRQFTILKNQTLEALEPAGRALLDVATTLAESLVPKLQEFGDYIADNQDGIVAFFEDTGRVIEDVGGKIGDVLGLIQDVVGAVKTAYDFVDDIPGVDAGGLAGSLATGDVAGIVTLGNFTIRDDVIPKVTDLGKAIVGLGGGGLATAKDLAQFEVTVEASAGTVRSAFGSIEDSAAILRRAVDAGAGDGSFFDGLRAISQGVGAQIAAATAEAVRLAEAVKAGDEAGRTAQADALAAATEAGQAAQAQVDANRAALEAAYGETLGRLTALTQSAFADPASAALKEALGPDNILDVEAYVAAYAELLTATVAFESNLATIATSSLINDTTRGILDDVIAGAGEAGPQVAQAFADALSSNDIDAFNALFGPVQDSAAVLNFREQVAAALAAGEPITAELFAEFDEQQLRAIAEDLNIDVDLDADIGELRRKIADETQASTVIEIVIDEQQVQLQVSGLDLQAILQITADTATLEAELARIKSNVGASLYIPFADGGAVRYDAGGVSTTVARSATFTTFNGLPALFGESLRGPEAHVRSALGEAIVGPYHSTKLTADRLDSIGVLRQILPHAQKRYGGQPSPGAVRVTIDSSNVAAEIAQLRTALTAIERNTADNVRAALEIADETYRSAKLKSRNLRGALA